MTNIREKIFYLEALEQAIFAIENLKKGEMTFKRDEDGSYATDDNGDWIMAVPDPVESPYSYGRYKAYEKIMSELEKLANK